MQSNWSRSVLFSLLAVLLVNIFHTFFLYEKKYEPLTITYTVSSDFDSFTWYSVTPKYDTAKYSTKSQKVLANKKTPITVVIEEPNGLQFLGLYWSWSDRGKFSISDVTISSQEKTWHFDQLEKLVMYYSNNLQTNIVENAFSATSTKKANGWIMLDFLEFEKIARVKKFKPLKLHDPFLLSIELFALNYLLEIVAN